MTVAPPLSASFIMMLLSSISDLIDLCCDCGKLCLIFDLLFLIRGIYIYIYIYIQTMVRK